MITLIIFRGLQVTVHSELFNPDEWDNAGTEENVPTDKWTVQRVYYYPVSNVVVVTYGQAVYDDYDAAYDGVSSEEVVLNSWHS
jgi:hypothetical protein